MEKDKGDSFGNDRKECKTSGDDSDSDPGLVTDDEDGPSGNVKFRGADIVRKSFGIQAISAGVKF